MKRGRRSEFEVATDVTKRPGGVEPETGVDAVDLRTAMKAWTAPRDFWATYALVLIAYVQRRPGTIRAAVSVPHRVNGKL